MTLEGHSLPGEPPIGADMGSPNRRQWIGAAASAGLGFFLSSGCFRKVPERTEPAAEGPLRFPGKIAMGVVNDRPPCLETPWHFYRHDLTPNDAFYVRWHLQFVPTAVDLRTWRLSVGGHVERPLEMSMGDLRSMPSTTVVAVNQCSGNSRSLSAPAVPGAQWGNGAMGNARWTGVPLRDLLSKAGVKSGAMDVSFAALDRGGYRTVPDFTKSLAIEKASGLDVLVAYEMNGEPLPLLNGFPVRLVVCGWYATYWVKALTEITVLSHKFDGFWMSKAYRIPTTPDAMESPTKLATQTVPINRMNVRSFFVRPGPGMSLTAGDLCPLEGIAFDGGSGIARVEVSTDGGANWRNADLGPDLGPYSFRRWHLAWQPEQKGRHVLQVRATSCTGETQPAVAGWNRAGYMRNVIEELTVDVK